MAHFKFDPAKIARLDDPGRFDTLIPEVMWDAFGLDDPETLVEIGAGTGMFAARFASLAPRAVVYAADTSERMLEWMSDHRPEVAEGRVVPIHAEETSVPLDDEVADGLYMIAVHHELVDAPASYAEAFRLVKPGGRILVVDWAPIETPKGPPQEVRATPEQLAEALREAGFEDAQPVAGLPWHGMAAAGKPAGVSSD